MGKARKNVCFLTASQFRARTRLTTEKRGYYNFYIAGVWRKGARIVNVTIYRQPILNAGFGMDGSMYNRRDPDAEVERALAQIGEDKLRHWAAVLLLDQACAPGMDELVPQVYRRGLLMEGLAGEANLDVPSGKAFMFGISSALDKVFGESIEEISDQLALGKSMRSALLFGEKNDFYALLQAADAVEKNGENPQLPSAFSGLGKSFLANLLWKCQVNTEYITLSLEYTVPEAYKGNILH